MSRFKGITGHGNNLPKQRISWLNHPPMHHKGLEDYFVMSLSGCREHLFVRKLGGNKWGNVSIQSWGLYIFSKSMTSSHPGWKGHSKGSVFIYFDWLSGGLVLSGKFISPLGGRALENQLFHQYSCPSYLWASEIFSDHWALPQGGCQKESPCT